MLKQGFFSLIAIYSMNSFSLAVAQVPNEEMLEGYRAIHSALTQDDLAATKEAAIKLSRSLENWIHEGATHPELPSVQTMLEATKALTEATENEAIRIQYGNVSKGLVTFIKHTAELQGRFQLFFCPMFPQGYAYWVQVWGEKIANPYWGKKMLTCGSKKPW